MVLGAAHRSFDFLFSGAFPDNWAARHCSYGEEMTDRELLELAAKAAGIEFDGEWSETDRMSFSGGGFWNPLTDDGDALRLAVKLGLCVGPNFDADRVVVDAGEFSQHHVYQMFDDDKFAATRRAIVRAAAEIGKEMK